MMTVSLSGAPAPVLTGALVSFPQVRLVNTTTSHTLSVCFIPHVNGNRCAGAVTVVQAGCWTQVQGGFTPATASATVLLSGVPAGVGMQVHSFVVAALDPAHERARQDHLIDQVSTRRRQLQLDKGCSNQSGSISKLCSLTREGSMSNSFAIL